MSRTRRGPGVWGEAVSSRMMVGALVLALVAVALPLHEAEAATACSRGSVALTFDDGPHGTYTPKVLDILRGRKAKATFFQVGTAVTSHPSITRRTHDEGHRVGNHTWRHDNLTKLSTSAIRDTLRRTNRRIAETGAPKPTMVRPPYGATNSRVRAVIGELGMTQVLWTVDPQDWRSGRSASTITNLVTAGLHDGANILLHDAVGNSKNTVAALPGIIDTIRSRGYCIGTLSSTGKVTPPRPVVRIGDAEIKEGAAGTTTTASLTVTLSEPTSRSVSLGYTTANGTAVAGEDYGAKNGTLTFAVGQTSKRISVRIKGDDLDEVDERFTIELSKPAGATISRTTGTVTVLDDDPAPTVRIDDMTVTEGPAGTTTTVAVPVRLSSASGRTVTVGYTTRDGTAIAGSDYTATTGTVTFSPGQRSRTVTVAVRGDELNEPNETLTVVLRDPSRTAIARGTSTVTIVDDDPAPTVRIEDVSVTEGPAGTTTTVAVPVRLSSPSGRTVTVGYTTRDGTAIAGSDYTATTGTVTFSPGQAAKHVEVAILGDGVHEGDEVLSVELHAPSNSTVARATGRVTIVDADPPPPSGGVSEG